VSSLRSHFEQMANSKPKNITVPRAVSPKPISNTIGTGSENHSNRLEAVGSVGEGPRVARGRERETANVGGLRPPRTNDPTSLSPSPTRNLRPRPTPANAPAVTIQPPQSPPKSKTLNLTLAGTSGYLSTDAPLSSTPGTSSPRHFRIPSRPHTPLLEPRKSPSLPASQPPSPPPPRRSGEMRRDASFKTAPPPVNRAEKPKITGKPSSLVFNVENSMLVPGPVHSSNEKSSPFSTPPSSDSSPEQELPAPALSRNRPQFVSGSNVVIPMTSMAFEPPPVHHSVASKRRDQEMNGLGRSLISPQVTGDQRPALPNRPQATPEIAKTRTFPQNAMLPPPLPRASMDRTQPTIVTSTNSDNTNSVATPPKRVFSTPTTQLQTPPRSHGRSMTVDRTSDRTPLEFRTPITTTAPRLEGRPFPDVAPSASYIKETVNPNLGEYPDFSHSNRRPPFFKHGAREVSTKYDTRIFDACGEYVCTSGHLTRVWSLLDGEIIMSLAHTEGIKIVSVAFKPASDVSGEGSRLWLGNNIGELIELDVATQSVVASKVNAHTRREIIKMYRHLNEMWTLDDGGTLHLWAPDNSGSPSLTNPYQSFRVPKGHTFSMVVGNELWHATGKDIRVFVPTLEGTTQFQVLQRPLSQPNAGDVSSGTTISTQPDRVYFGHVDGKVSIYSRHDYLCLGVVGISVYKITSLAGVNGNLWAGFSTGMVYVYDTTHTPWLVRKDWRAHHDPLISLLADRSSLWTLDRAQVISLGQDNMIRVWDGLLQDDWIGKTDEAVFVVSVNLCAETQMQSQEANFCELKSIKTLVMTWNAGASTPYHLQHSNQDAAFFRDLLQSNDSPDILVFGFQELVDLEDKKTTASMSRNWCYQVFANCRSESFFKSKKKDPSEQEHMSHQYRDWRDFLSRCLDDYMPRGELYHLLHTASLVGLFTCIFVRASLRERIHSISGAEVKRGMGGLHGNKVCNHERVLLYV
jgi:hypothetical protein